MSKQEAVFLNSEADQWYLRNKDVLLNRKSEDDKITQFVKKFQKKPKKILELGCSNGYRLNFLNKELGSEVYGSDPSKLAIEEGQKAYPNVHLTRSTADELPYESESFDLIIFGFLLYLCDRSKLFRIASEADRVLKNDARILIYDFYTRFPYRNDYSHLSGVYSYKMQNSSMFLWNPNYMLTHSEVFSADGSPWRNQVDNTTALEVLYKNSDMGFPHNPYTEDQK